jgi:hypothetical protein
MHRTALAASAYCECRVVTSFHVRRKKLTYGHRDLTVKENYTTLMCDSMCLGRYASFWRNLQPPSSGQETNFNIHHSDIYNHTCRTMPWFSCKPVTAEAQVQNQASSCGICGGQSGITLIFLWLLRFSHLRITSPMLHTDSSVTDTI